MERLGLWGIGTTFNGFENFLDSITKRGLGECLYTEKILTKKIILYITAKK